MPLRSKILLLLTSFSILAVLPGCQSTEEFSPGTYHTTHQGQSWVLEFEPDGNWTGTFSGEILSSGTYVTDGELLTWLTDSHCQETGYPGPATYRVRNRNNSLTFSKVGNDPCLSRQVILEDEVYQLED